MVLSGGEGVGGGEGGRERGEGVREQKVSGIRDWLRILVGGEAWEIVERERERREREREREREVYYRERGREGNNRDRGGI